MNEIGGLIALFLLMTIVGLELSPRDFRRVAEQPRAVVGGMLGQWIALPLLTWGIVWAFGLPATFGAGAVLVAVSPGAGISNILVALGRGNVALSVTLTATASAFAVVTLPTLASLAMGLFFEQSEPVRVPVASLVGQLFVSLLVPITLGMVVRAHHPELAGRLAPRLQRLLMVLIALFVVLGIAFAPEEQLDFQGSGRASLAAAVWSGVAGLVGWGLARALELPEADRFTFAIEFAARNVAVATIVAMSGLERVDLTFFSGLYVATGYPMAAAFAFWHRRRVGRG